MQHLLAETVEQVNAARPAVVPILQRFQADQGIDASAGVHPNDVR
jgi:hypothetical protein